MRLVGIGNWLRLSVVLLGVGCFASKICNQDTQYNCVCTRCHKLFEDLRNDSLVIEFEKCSDIEELNLEHLRSRIASWLKEECSFILRCAQPFANLNAHNVIVSEVFCAPEGLNSRLGLFVRWNASEPVQKKSNQIDVETMLSVIGAREHLVTESLHSALIRMGSGREIVPEKRLIYSFAQLMTFAGISALTTFILSSLLVLCVAYQIVGWKRLRHGFYTQNKPSLAQLNKELRLRAGDQAQIQEIPLNRFV